MFNYFKNVDLDTPNKFICENCEYEYEKQKNYHLIDKFIFLFWHFSLYGKL